MTTLAQLTAELQRLEREHGPDCSVRTFDLALYKHGYLHRLTFDYPAEREAAREAKPAPAAKCEAQMLCEWNEAADVVALHPPHLSRRVSEEGLRTDYTLADGSVYIVSQGKHSTRAFWDKGEAQ